LNTYNPPVIRIMDPSKSEKVKVIVVDGGGVLFGSVPVPMLRVLSKRYPEEKRHDIETIHTVNKKAWTSVCSDRHYTVHQFWQDTLVPLGVTESSEELDKMLRESLVLDNNILSLLTNAKQQGFGIAILSNHSIQWINHFIDKFNLTHSQGGPFNRDLIIASQNVGCKKPSPQIYQVLMDHIHQHISNTIQPSQVIFIDDKEENIEAAKNLGLNGFVWNRKENKIEEFLAGLSQFGIELDK